MSITTRALSEQLGQAHSAADAAMLDLVQSGTLAYFWHFAHPVSGMARERSNPAGYDYLETVTTGGTGFGIIALLAASERGFLTRQQVRQRITRIVAFLGKAERHHGVFSHFLHGSTGKTIPFSPLDDGGDLVETAFLMMGLLCARDYFARNQPSLQSGSMARKPIALGGSGPSRGSGGNMGGRGNIGSGLRKQGK
jgi:hypothetical protein